MAQTMSKNDPLVGLFGTPAKVKLLRFFLFNPERVVSFDEIAKKARLVRRTARTELNQLERAGIIYRKQFYEENPDTGRRRRVMGYTLNTRLSILPQLQKFFFETAPINHKTVNKHLRAAGPYDFISASGVFVGEFDRAVDLLIVSKKAKQTKVEQAIRTLEAELGIELKFAFLDTDEFVYRIGMRDRLVRDVFDYPHEIITDKLAVHGEALERA